MNITNNNTANINIGNNATSNGTQINRNTSGQIVINSSMLEMVDGPQGNNLLLNSSEGDIFSGKIIDVTNNMVSISADGSSVINAKMAEAVNLNIGDTLSFIVKENKDNVVIIKPISDSSNSSKDNTIFKVLENNGFSPTGKNYLITEKLMDNNMPIDKGSMQNIIRQSYMYPDVSLDTLIDLNKNGIEVNSLSVSQYSDYINGNHQLAGNISEFAGDVAGLINNMDIAQSVERVMGTAQNILGIMSDESDMANIARQGADGGQNSVSSQMSEEDINSYDNKLNSLQNSTNNVLDKNNFNNRFSESANISELLSKLAEAGVSKEQLNSITDKSKSILQLLNNINQASGLSEDILANIIKSNSYVGTLKEAVTEKFSLKPSEMKDSREIDELYSKIQDKTTKLINIFSNTEGESKGAMNQSAKNLSQRIDFIQQLNQNYAYAQIPVNFNGDKANSELFVYMNKKNQKKDNGEVSALLHLDMEHLGATDVHVSLNGSIVHTKFYVEDETSAKIIDEHMTMLEQEIATHGFTLSNEVITREPTLHNDNNMVVDEMIGNSVEQSIRRYSFDVRM